MKLNYINKCFNSSNLFKNNVKLRYELRINSRNFIKDTLKKMLLKKIPILFSII